MGVLGDTRGLCFAIGGDMHTASDGRKDFWPKGPNYGIVL